MSRDGRDDVRADVLARTQDREADRAATRDGLTRRPGVPIDGLALPRVDRREVVEFRQREYRLRGSETRILATVGAFQVVTASDLDTRPPGCHVWEGDLGHLATEGLITRESAVIGHDSRPIVILTREGKALLDAHQQPHADGRQQQYHAGLGRARDVVHNAQLYRLYQAESARIEEEGGRVTRVVIDQEFRRDYHRFLSREGMPLHVAAREDVWTFANAQELSVIDGHLQLPDVRIEYEADDGRLAHRDVELVTDHYSRAVVAGKSRAGFALYHAPAAGWDRAGSPRIAGRSFGPHDLRGLP